MNLKSKFKLFFKSVFTKFGALVSDEGQQIIWQEDGEIAEGLEVFYEVESEEGEIEYQPVPNGEYKYENKTIVVEDGKVSEIRVEEEEAPAEEQPAEQMEEEAPATEEAPADPTTEEVVTTEEEPFDAKKAYDELRIEFEAMKVEFDALKEQLAKLLEEPAEDDAFSAAKKNEEEIQKGFVCKVAKK